MLATIGFMRITTDDLIPGSFADDDTFTPAGGEVNGGDDGLMHE
jgi:hypothetical protein